ncbi:MAG: hypothetical protein NC180_02395 [Muribaculaceae bacterium]|nr:hypothetical protein [Roseburia sp.]MCM1431589.1 hypothetical protein [Muribaculaceae bacterium]MCM1492054.1 hypothetical protein [Muribaculaceae bacterium]
MKVIQLLKKLNNTELGKAGTNDSYVLIPNDLDITDLFETVDAPVVFTDMETGEAISVRNTVGREKRIVGLGQYYRSKDLSAGDEIVFEKRCMPDHVKYLVYVRKHNHALVFQKERQGFEILTPGRLAHFESMADGMGENVAVRFLCSGKKRNDSPENTDFYDISIDGESILGKFHAKEIGELDVGGGGIKLKNFYGWKKYCFEMEG